MTACKFTSTTTPRVLTSRHDDGCEDEGCRGCLPCVEAHCRSCGIVHVQGIAACPGCVAEARENLDEIDRMCDDLPEEVEVRGVDGEAFNLLGPVADPEARGHMEASVLSGRVPAEYLEVVVGEMHPTFVAERWASVYRDAFGHDEPVGRVNQATETGYLRRNLTEAAAFEHVPFEDMARDLRKCVTHLEHVLHDGEQIEKGAPCPMCHRSLLLVYGGRVIDDRWKCANNHCEVSEYTTAQYQGWVEDDALHGADRLTAADMERRFRDEDDEPLVKPGEVRVWGSRELIRKRGRNDQGMTLYDVSDVETRIEARLAAAPECA